MNRDAVARLSEGQRQCLRMVYRHMETKEIARELGISPDGVTQRIKAAMRTLGVNRRREAALLLAQAEGPEVYPPLVYPPRDIEIASDPAMLGSSTEGARQREHSGEALREEQAVFTTAIPSRSPTLPLAIGRTRPDDLGLLGRLTWIAVITIGIALAFGALVAGVQGLTQLIWG